jgi:hypothetical protein
MARRNLQNTELPSLVGGVDYDSDVFEVQPDCLIASSNILPALSVGGLTVINGYTVQNPNSPLQSNYVRDTSQNIVTDTSGNITKGDGT